MNFALCFIYFLIFLQCRHALGCCRCVCGNLFLSFGIAASVWRVVVFIVVIADNPLIILVITLIARAAWSADPLCWCCNSPGHTPSGCSSHDQNCCGVFDSDDCLQVFSSFIWTPGCVLMHETSDTQQSSAEDLHGDIPPASNECMYAPTYGCLGRRSPRKQQEYKIWRQNPIKRLVVIEEGRREREPAALISLVLDVLVLLSCNCNQSDSDVIKVQTVTC